MRLRVFWIFIVILLIAAAFAGFRVATWPGFFAKSVTVFGTNHVSVADVLTRAAIPSDHSVWLIDKHAAEARVDSLAWVRTTHIHRVFPANVRITVVERTPVACIESSSGAYLVDASGAVIETSCNAASNVIAIGWPSLAPQHAGSVVDVTQLSRFLTDVGTLRAHRLEPARASFDRFGGLEVTLGGGIIVRFGDDRDLAAKAGLVDPILQAYGKRTGDVAVIDLRAPATPVVEERRRNR
jgi:cell division protein FtsQ